MSTQSRRFPFTASEPGVDPREDALDDTIESSFPASDPPSTIPDPAFAEPTRGPDAGASPSRLAQVFDTSRLPKDALLWAAIGALGASALVIGLYGSRWRPRSHARPRAGL